MVPEWEDCYINYRTLKMLLRLIRTTTIDRLDIEKSLTAQKINPSQGLQSGASN